MSSKVLGPSLKSSPSNFGQSMINDGECKKFQNLEPYKDNLRVQSDVMMSPDSQAATQNNNGYHP